MIFAQICIGSSCHLKGSQRIVELFQERIAKEKLDETIVLSGSFCLNKCNRVGVTITLSDGNGNDEIIPGVTPESFNDFWREHVAPRL